MIAVLSVLIGFFPVVNHDPVGSVVAGQASACRAAVVDSLLIVHVPSPDSNGQPTGWGMANLGVHEPAHRQVCTFTHFTPIATRGQAGYRG